MEDKGQARKGEGVESAAAENSELFYSPYRRTREQIDRDVDQGRVYPLADVLFTSSEGRSARSSFSTC